MQTNVHQAPTSVCTEICEKHATEIVKFFCKQHAIVGFGDCMILEHKSCKVDYIPDIAEAFLKGSELIALVREISRLQSIVNLTSEDIDRAETEADKAYVETVNDIRTFRKEINDYLDRMEQQLLDKCDTIKQENTNMNKKMAEDFKHMAKELDIIHAQLTSQSEQSTNMFVKARKAGSSLKTLEGQLSAIDRRSKIEIFNSKRSQVINNVVSKCSPLGEIKVRNIAQQQRKTPTKRSIVNAIPKQEGVINVKSSSDGRDCYISGIVTLNDTTLACTDWFNNKVKLIDITRGALTSEIDVPPPWDLTLVPNEEIAVSLTFERKIQFLSFRQSLCKGRFIKVNGSCRGIAYSNDKLVVSFEGVPKVETLTLQGKVLHCITTDNTATALFDYPLYVAVSSGDEIIYVSNSKANSVNKLTFDGQVLATYKDLDFMDPRDLVVCEDGHVLVCSYSKSNIQLVSPKGKRLKNILERKDGVDLCLALCYDEDKNMLYLSNCNSGNQIQIYKIK
ncbi:uncharacterized protein LOC123558765 [Mercenaria mercenaria]|uniref:uncharacterized protein LOC123558765 n=1 Tax=Mercenaria mercenaria TaxID=6596 RepID=UPI00234F02F3|nr:uncharacterized protein LOC123558765 [Mercenaria mercenaria]